MAGWPCEVRTGAEEDVADRRAAILEAAARVIARRGVRGLRVEELAAEARVSTALIYYHFKDRAGILRQTMEFISDRAGHYTTDLDPKAAQLGPRGELERALLMEFQDAPLVRENSTAWGELRASAIFDPDLREDLRRASLVWVQEIAELLGRVQPLGTPTALASAAERLTALVEGLSGRWLSGVLPLDHARNLLGEAIDVELQHLERR
ncbi:TetR/AcrR family transcriptional regulator [Streptomyces sp. NPDC006879]|uniref:TetR/AcrR family transcriptional regulator n=1 Tax=Streptomyces sp. NPDC006879 TaxID=3364767 RepID=UPI00369BC83F